MPWQKITEERLRNLAARGFTQAEASRRLGVSRAAISYRAQQLRARGKPVVFKCGRTRDSEVVALSASISVDLMNRLNEYMKTGTTEKLRNRVVEQAIKAFLDERELT